MKNRLTRIIIGAVKNIVNIMMMLNGGQTSALTKYYYPNIMNRVRIQKTELTRKIAIGSNSHIDHSQLSGNIIIGRDCKIKGAEISGQVCIGNQTSLWGPDITITCKIHPVNIGNYCSIARNVFFFEYNHRTDRLSSYYMAANIFGGSLLDDIKSKGPIMVKNDVWIGANSMILSGVSIGNGAVIAAGSVVNKDIPDYAIAGGNPAKIIGYRFNPQTIEHLLASRWWDWPKEKIIANKHLFEGLPDENHFNHKK